MLSNTNVGKTLSPAAIQRGDIALFDGEKGEVLELFQDLDGAELIRIDWMRSGSGNYRRDGFKSVKLIARNGHS